MFFVENSSMALYGFVGYVCKGDVIWAEPPLNYMSPQNVSMLLVIRLQLLKKLTITCIINN